MKYAEQKIEWMRIIRMASLILNEYRELESCLEKVGHGEKLDPLFVIGGMENLIFSAVGKLIDAGLSESDIKTLREWISTIENISAASNVMKQIRMLLEDKSEEFLATVAEASAKDCETLLDETSNIGNAIGAFEERKEREKRIRKN